MDATKRDAILAALQKIVGARHVLTDPALFAGALVEPRGLYHGKALALVRPGATREVAAVAALCNEARIGMVPQGGNTGLVGGQTPDMSGEEIIVSTQRLRAVREVDIDADVMICESGRHAGRGASRGARRRSAVSAVARVGRHLHHRRQCLDQRRRRDRDRLRQHARPRDRGRSGSRRRPHRQWLKQAAQGQHRLRCEEPLRRRRGDARHRHRRFAPAVSQSARAGDGFRRLSRVPTTR